MRCSINKVLIYFSVLLLTLIFRSADAQTPTNTPTALFTLTPALTATATPTVAGTATFTLTSTPTATGTLTPSVTPTSTDTATFTATPTPTHTLTPTPTATSTPGVFQFTVSPKPDGQGQVHFSWGTTIPADEAFLKIYTSGFRVVREFVFNRKENPEFLPAGVHDFTWDGKDEQKRAMAPGTYLCFINVNVGKKRYEASGKTEIP